MPRKGIKKQFWLSEKHVKKLEKLSEKTRLPEVKIIRFLLDGYHPKEAPRDEFFDRMNDIIEACDKLELALKSCKDSETREAVRNEISELKKLRAEIQKEILLPEKVKELV